MSFATAGASPAWQVLGTGLPGIITYTVVWCLLHSFVGRASGFASVTGSVSAGSSFGAGADSGIGSSTGPSVLFGVSSCIIHLRLSKRALTWSTFRETTSTAIARSATLLSRACTVSEM